VHETKVQVIVPVYNAEKYLERCLGSLKKQTYQNWEAFLIDDASTDRGCEIIKKYQDEDTRFSYFRLDKNEGVSNVRNYALGKLCEKYTAFLDSDDFWEADMLYEMVNKAEKEQCDVVQCRYIYDYPDNKQILPKGAFAGDVILDEKEMKKVYIRMMTGINMNHVCMKLIRTEIIKDIRFDAKLKTAEDLQFCIKMFKNVKKYCFIDKVFYHYCRNEESLTGKGLSGKEKLYANRQVAKDMKMALKDWGIDTFFWRSLCVLRPYIIIVSKVFRIVREKVFCKK